MVGGQWLSKLSPFTRVRLVLNYFYGYRKFNCGHLVDFSFSCRDTFQENQRIGIGKPAHTEPAHTEKAQNNSVFKEREDSRF
jgi:hypothetical protein